MEISKIYEKCKLLKVDCIKEELDSYLKGFNLDNINNYMDKFIFVFSDDVGSKIILELDYNSIYLFKTTNNVLERVNIDDNLNLTSQMVEKRDNGVVFDESLKLFAKSKIYDKCSELVEVVHNRYVFSKEKIEEMFNYNNHKYEELELLQILLQIKINDYDDELKKCCNLYTSFCASVKYSLPWYDVRRITDDVGSVKVNFNGVDISECYKSINGFNKVYRIYDLYNGVINDRNIIDIDEIRFGRLSSNCFDLYGYYDIRKKEEKIVGKSFVNNDEYMFYLKKLFSERYNYQENFNIDRKTLVEIIKCNVSDSDVTKNILERICKFPYSEFDKLDFIEQYKLAKEVYKKKRLKCK